MFHCVLYQPEIPPNTGNIIRLCANTAVKLHLIHPLGFVLTDKHLKRAGLDYHQWALIQEHTCFEAFWEQVQPQRLWACSTRGQQCYADFNYHPGDAFLFGPETRGLPPELFKQATAVIRIPMQPGQRSLNLANAVAVVIYEAWRQHQFQ